MVWCWKPSRTVASVNEEDYMCCCKSITAKDGFSAFIILDITVIAYSLFTLFVQEPAYKTFFYGYAPLLILMIFLGIRAVQTLKPVYMQVYVIIWIIQTICAVLIAGLLLLSFFLVTIGLSSSNPIDEYGRSFKETGMMVAIFMDVGLLVFLLLTLWRILVTFKFYKYVVDRQLSLEPTSVTVK